jgi:hypothetical protein
MTEDLLVGIRVMYHQKKNEFEEKFLNASGSIDVASRAGRRKCRRQIMIPMTVVIT